MSRRSKLEKVVQREIELALGAQPDLMLLRNSLGLAKYVSDDGKAFSVPYGLGEGSPDLVGILRSCVQWNAFRTLDVGRWFCLEVKAPGEKATDEQEKCHDVWRKFGAFVAVVDSAEAARAALERARRGES